MLCPIAEGGMASVWVARLIGKRGFQKLVALKTILPKFAEDPRFERMFLDEAGLAAKIEHANVAQVLDLGEEHNVLYLAMELVDGDSLSKLVRAVQKNEGTIPTGVALRILADTCGGLHAAHELQGEDGRPLNVVHRDVSPQNILVTMNGIAKLIDFGIAKARDRVSEDTNDGVLKGKIHYMAPEQAVGKQVDRRSDIWAVGSILYSLLAGKPPYEGENHLATLHLLVSGRPPEPLPDAVPPEVSDVVHRALSHDPSARFATAAEMQAALEAAMVAAKLVTTTSDVAVFVREHMADRAKKRKEAMDLALSAASQREKVARMLEKAGSDSSSGHDVLSDHGEIPVVDATYPTVRLGDSECGDPEGSRPSIPSEASAATMGSLGSALASPVPPAGLPRKPGWPAAVILGVLLLGVGVAAGFAVKSGSAPTSAAARPIEAPPITVPAPASSPPMAAPPLDPSTTVDASAAVTAPAPSSATSAPGAARGPVRFTKPAQPKPSVPAKHRVNDGF
jgi:eukaryotic-like serine/threonine-protein kinase